LFGRILGNLLDRGDDEFENESKDREWDDIQKIFYYPNIKEVRLRTSDNKIEIVEGVYKVYNAHTMITAKLISIESSGRTPDDILVTFEAPEGRLWSAEFVEAKGILNIIDDEEKW